MSYFIRLFGWVLRPFFRKKIEREKTDRERYFVEDLAEALNQNYHRVYCAIKKLGIKPQSELGKRKRYSKSTLIKLSRYFKIVKPYKQRKARWKDRLDAEVYSPDSSLNL